MQKGALLITVTWEEKIAYLWRIDF